MQILKEWIATSEVEMPSSLGKIFSINNIPIFFSHKQRVWQFMLIVPWGNLDETSNPIFLDK